MDSEKAALTLSRDFILSPVDDRLYGSFIEHIGRAVYGGISEPGHPTADRDGFRRDVLALVREIGVPVVRYPGGNFVSGYNWEDGIGPRQSRPRRQELAWCSTETNAFGLDEFCAWCKAAESEPMMAVNLGTRGVEAARDIVEYSNHPGGTYWSDLRVRNGVREPHGIKLWCLGNEMDGPWQIGHKTAYEYGRLACEAGRVMKLADPSIELVACGSSFVGMPTFPSWEAEVLDECYEQSDYISLHTYYGNFGENTGEFLARTVSMNEYIRSVISVCDYIKAKKRSKKTMMLSFDEWNVWYHSHGYQPEPWAEAPPINEDIYNMEDALLVGSMLITLINNADRVKVACLAQLINVIAPIMTETGGGVYKQTIFYPYLHASRFGRGTALRCAACSPVYSAGEFEDVPALDQAAVLSADGSTITVFAVNRSQDALDLALTLQGFEGFTPYSHTVLRNDDLKAVNTLETPDNVRPHEAPPPATEDGSIHATLPAYSWNVIILKSQ